MSKLSPCLGLAAIAALTIPAATVSAQCGFIDFENLAVGTNVTNQYPGVTFSGRNSNGTPGLPPRIYNPGAHTSSPTRALVPAGDGINEFSCDYMRIDFAAPQRRVAFSLGAIAGCVATDTCQVRWYDPGGTAHIQNIAIDGSLFNTCGRRVLLESAAVDISRIEIQYGVVPLCACAYEMIDDFEYDLDPTPPIVQIASPAPLACVCDSATLTGVSYDPDGTYHDDKLEYATNPSGPWTFIQSFSESPVSPPGGTLYIWNTSALPSGYYFLRLTATNDCGLDTQVVTVVYVDNTAPGINLRTPPAGAIVGGQVCFDGTVVDNCSLTSYTVRYRPAGGGAFNPVDPAIPSYNIPVTNDPFAFWQTASGGAAVADGNYIVEVSATDACGQNTATTRPLTVDNTAPVALITTPINCSRIDQGFIQIRGTASDAHMGGWAVQYTGGDAHTWTPIPGGSGAGNVVNGLLATWDARALRDCCYAIRLVVTDAVNVNCGDTHRTEYVVAFDLGSTCTQDYNGDGVVNSQDFFDFLNIFFSGCP